MFLVVFWLFFRLRPFCGVGGTLYRSRLFCVLKRRFAENLQVCKLFRIFAAF